MKSKNVEIKNLDKLILQKHENEKREQKQTFKEIIKELKRKIDETKEFLLENLLMYDFEAYQKVLDKDGKISWPLYLQLQKTDLWRKGKRLKYEINRLSNVKQPEWKNTALHHENPYPWEHLFSKGIISTKDEHREIHKKEVKTTG